MSGPPPKKMYSEVFSFLKKIKVTPGIFQPMRIGQIGRTSAKSTNRSTEPARNRTALANAHTHTFSSIQPANHTYTFTRTHVGHMRADSRTRSFLEAK